MWRDCWSQQITRLKTNKSSNARDIVEWAQENYYIYDEDTGFARPIKLLEHRQRILRDITRRDETGKMPYQTMVYSAVKKSGKTEIASLFALWWAWQEPYNEIYVLANDEEQAQSRVYQSVIDAITKHPEISQEIPTVRSGLRFPNGTVIRALASDYAGAAGSRHGLTVWDELWAYCSGNAQRLWDELTPIPTRKNSLRLVVTYAGFEGESTTLRDLYDRGMAGERLYDDLPAWVDGDLYMYWDEEPRMPWQTEEYYESQRKTLRPNAFLRMHRNQWTTNTETFIDMDW